MKENSKKDTLSRKAPIEYFKKAPIECHLCNKKLKSKSGYTLHLKNVLKIYMFHNRIKLKQFSR